ncbi:MAG: hypothetical protein Q9163_005718 [Psora crenata]
MKVASASLLPRDCAHYLCWLAGSGRELSEQEKDYVEKSILPGRHQGLSPETYDCHLPSVARKDPDTFDRPAKGSDKMVNTSNNTPKATCISPEDVLAMEYKQRSAWKFMEQSVRPQKASEVQLDRFCDLLQRPSVFESVSRVVKELNLDQSHTTHPNPMIAQILRATQHLRPTPSSTREVQGRSEWERLPLSPKLSNLQSFLPHTPPSKAATAIGEQDTTQLPSVIESAPGGMGSSSSKPPESKPSELEPIAAARQENQEAELQAQPWSEQYQRPTQVEDLIKIPVQTPFSTVESRLALLDACQHLWEAHCSGKGNTTPLYPIQGSGLWKSGYPDDQYFSTKDTVRRMIKDMITLDDKKPWTPTNYIELAEALADEEYGGVEALEAMAQEWRGMEEGPTKAKTASGEEDEWMITFSGKKQR